MNAYYDVIIVGARVAGSATAHLLSRMGHRVLLIDRNHPATTDTLSTHAIMRTGVLQLQRWGVLQRIIDRGTPPLRQLTLGFGSNRVTFDFRLEYGVDALYAPRRPILDAALLDAALEAGVEFQQGRRLLDLVRDASGRVTGVVTTDGRAETVMPARFVVGADGLRSRVASIVNAAAYEAHEPANVLTYAYYDGIEGGRYESQFTPGLATGFFPTNDNQTCVFASRPIAEGTIDDEEEFGRIIEAASPEMGDQLRRATRAGRFFRSLGIPGFLRVPGGPGWALVGDAGFTKDPLSARGISDALRDAELCARAVDGVLSGRQSDDQAMAGYRVTRDRFAVPAQQATHKLAHFEWDEAEASTLLRELGKIIDAECHFLSELEPPAGATAVAPAKNGSVHSETRAGATGAVSRQRQLAHAASRNRGCLSDGMRRQSASSSANGREGRRSSASIYSG
jgi:2-polyprenyl-6-methoxyphenol hydroxylase-like FAD-dependent oxidoreductase